MTGSTFVESINPIDLGLTHASAFIASFQLNCFQHSLFDKWDIHCPERIRQCVDKRAAEFLSGRILARHAVSSLGVKETQIPIGLNGEPVWPSGITGSISHSAGRCVCMASIHQDHLIGIDIEKTATGPAFEAIMDACLNKFERSLIINCDFMTRHQSATAFFSSKEAVFKALHPRVKRYIDFSSVEINSFSSTGKIRLVLKEDIGREFVRGTAFTTGYLLIGEHVLTWVTGQHPRS